jgi:hypothetical protein
MKKALVKNIKQFFLAKGFDEEALRILSYDELVDLAKEHYFLPR